MQHTYSVYYAATDKSLATTFIPTSTYLVRCSIRSHRLLVDYFLYPIRGSYHPRLAMDLTEQERVDAVSLKETLAHQATVASMSDFEIVQHSLVAKGDIQKALTRIRKIDKVGKKYTSKSSGLSNADALKKSFEMMQGTMTSFGLDTDGCPVIGCRYSAFDPNIFKRELDWVVVSQGMLVLLAAATYDFAAVRNGCVFLSDCHGIGWSNFSVEVEKHFAEVCEQEQANPFGLCFFNLAEKAALNHLYIDPNASVLMYRFLRMPRRSCTTAHSL